MEYIKKDERIMIDKQERDRQFYKKFVKITVNFQKFNK